MSNYIDGFVFPIQKKYIEEYRKIAEQIAEIWKEYGALAYFEYVGDDLYLEGTNSFPKLLHAKENESIVFGWVTFNSKEARDLANEHVPKDPRMNNLISPLIDPNNIIFNAKRMAYGGFKPLICSFK